MRHEESVASSDGRRVGLVPRFVSVGLAMMLVLGATVVALDSAGAACVGPELRIGSDTVQSGRNIELQGRFFLETCEDVIENGQVDAAAPIQGIHLAVRQGELDYGVAVVDATDDPAIGGFTVTVTIPGNFAVGAAEIVASVPDLPPVAVPITITADRPTIRVAGGDRIETAVAISERAFPDGAATVYLADANMPIDAMVGGVLQDGPILLVPSCGELPRSVAVEIDRLRPGVIGTLGGPAAVCDDVLQAAAAI